MIKGLSNARPGIVAIDLHRGHLDPAVAIMPLEADAAARVVSANEPFCAGHAALASPTPKNTMTATDLDLSLRSHGVETVLIAGVNAHSCVTATAAAACCRDYAVIATAFSLVATADDIMSAFKPAKS